MTDVSAVVQGISAAIGVILTLVIMFQNKKIKELVDITDELAKHTVELQKQNATLISQHNLEKKLSLRQRIAFFQKFGPWTAKENNQVSFEIRNIGIEASNFKIEYNRNNDTSILTNDKTVYPNSVIHLFVTFPKGNTHDPFDFDISFTNPEGNKIAQRVHSISPNDYEVDPPVDYL